MAEGKAGEAISAEEQAVKDLDIPVHNWRSRLLAKDVLPDAIRIRDILGIPECGAGTLLDVGCGGGWLDVGLHYVTDLEFTLVDISPRAVEGTKEDVADFCFIDRARVLQTDVHELPFEDESFDYVMTTSSIGFWHNPQTGIEQCYRVLKPGGNMFIRGFDGNRYIDFWGCMKDTHIEDFAMKRDEDMSWIEIHKPLMASD